MDDGELVRQTPAGMFGPCLSRNKPVRGSRNVHIVRPGEQRALCGTLSGQEPDREQLAALRVCAACHEKYGLLCRAPKPEPSSGEPDPAMELHEWKASILSRADGLAEVALNGFSELLNTLIRETPGRKWDRENRVWLIPAAWVPDLAASLFTAGVEVRVTVQQAVLCSRCRQELALASGTGPVT